MLQLEIRFINQDVNTHQIINHLSSSQQVHILFLDTLFRDFSSPQENLFLNLVSSLSSRILHDRFSDYKETLCVVLDDYNDPYTLDLDKR